MSCYERNPAGTRGQTLNATIGSAGIARNFNTTVNAPPDRPPPPIADEIVDDTVHLINSGLRSNISAHSSQAA